MAALCVVTVLPAALLMGATFPLAARLWAAGSDRLGQRLGGIYGGQRRRRHRRLARGRVRPGAVARRAPRAAAARGAATCWSARSLLVVLGRRRWPIAGRGRWPWRWSPGARPGRRSTRSSSPSISPTRISSRTGKAWKTRSASAATHRGIQTLFTNSRGQTNDAPDLVRYHRVMGHLADLLAPNDAPRALVVGLGAGATPGAMAQHSGAQVDVVELSEAVIAAAPLFSVANARRAGSRRTCTCGSTTAATFCCATACPTT